MQFVYLCKIRLVVFYDIFKNTKYVDVFVLTSTSKYAYVCSMLSSYLCKNTLIFG